MTKKTRVPVFVRVFNAIVALLLRRGVRLGTGTLLTVPGRKSGLPRTTPVSIIEYDGGRYLQSPRGDVDWVRNLRASGNATLTRGRHVKAVSAVELPPEEAAPVLKHALTTVPSPVRSFFDVSPDSPLEAIAREAPRHPVFQLGQAPSEQAATT